MSEEMYQINYRDKRARMQQTYRNNVPR